MVAILKSYEEGVDVGGVDILLPMSDGRVSDSDGRVSDGRVSDGRVSDGSASDGKLGFNEALPFQAT
jgi:hypothetical protein